jgi:4-methylaminobutanoate oxidase (formaldehyde-forming)
VIIGAGVLGASTAFHLTRLGREVLLLDRGPLAAETSSQGAGFLCSLRPTVASSRIVSRSTQFYRRFTEETGYAIDLHMHGGLRVAFSEAWYRHLVAEAAAAKQAGVEVHVIDRAEISRLSPGFNLEGAIGGTFTPEEGYVTATRDVGIGLARGAARQGASVRTGVEVTELLPREGGGYVVRTNAGDIAANKVVMAANAGAWTLCRGMGAIYPSYPLHHECAVYDLPNRISDRLPTIRLGERDLYIRHEAGGLMIGGVGGNPDGPAPDAGRASFMQQSVEPEVRELDDAKRRAAPYVPGLDEALCFRIQRGLAMVAPDLEPVAGEWMSDLYVVSADLRGVQSAPMLGLMVAELVADGKSEFDHRPFDPRRFASIRDPRHLSKAARDGLRPRAYE